MNNQGNSNMILMNGDLSENFKNILMKNGLGDFFHGKNNTVDSFYILSNTLNSNNGKSIKFYQIRGKEEQGLIRFNLIKSLAENTKAELIKWKTSA
jgi:hypothetical protein